MGTLTQDVRYVLRTFRKSPSYALIVVLTLALGIGANSAVFSLINAVLMKPLPVRNPEQLVIVGDPNLVHTRMSDVPPHTDIFSYPLYRDLRDRSTVFSDLMASAEVFRVQVIRSGERQGSGAVTDEAIAALVSGNYFSGLGVNAAIGRTITPQDDDASGAHPVAVLRYDFWKDKLGKDPDIVGQTLILNSYPFTVIGVAAPGFFGDTVGDQQDIWVPVSMQSQIFRGRMWLNEYRNSWLHFIGRRNPGVSAHQAEAELNVIFQQLVDGAVGSASKETERDSLRRLRINVEDGSRGFSETRSEYQKPLWILMVIVALVLIIACVNLANLMLVRTFIRRAEIAVRLALGAPPWRIARQMLCESLILSFAGGALGLLVAYGGFHLLLRISHEPRLEVHLDTPVLLFTGGVCLVTGLLFGLGPAVRSARVNIVTTLKVNPGSETTEKTSRFSWNWGKVLVGSQVAISVLVLFASGLLVRSMSNLHHVNLGFDRDKILLVRVDAISAGYNTPRQRYEFAEQLAARLAVLPGVRMATYSENGLFYGHENSATIRVDGFVAKNNDDLESPTERVGPNYFSMLRIPLIRGRELGPQDTEDSTKVAVVNQSFARFYFGTQDPIGRAIRIANPEKPQDLTIVGVVGDAHGSSVRGEARRQFYIPLSQAPDTNGATFFLLKTGAQPEAFADIVRRTIKDFNLSLPITGLRTLDDRIDESLRGEILIAQLSGFFGAFALLLACLGLYGVMSYTVAGKTRSIGIRMALGAQRQDVLWLVLQEAITIIVIGVCVGVPLAFITSQFLASMLYGLKSSDPSSMFVVLLVLGVISLFAGFVPARRATRVQPIVAIKNE